MNCWTQVSEIGIHAHHSHTVTHAFRLEGGTQLNIYGTLESCGLHWTVGRGGGELTGSIRELLACANLHAPSYQFTSHISYLFVC
jgi:hypothetical protein